MALPEGSSPKRLHCEFCKKANAVRRVQKWRGDNPEKLAEQREKQLPGARVRAADRYAREPEVVLAANKRWKQAHPQEMRAYYAKWLTHPGNLIKAKGWVKAWMQAHPQEMRKYRQRWYVENQDLLRDLGARRRAVYASSSFRFEEWLEILCVFGHRCAYCLREDDHLTMDHMTPISRGGLHEAENIIPACRSCNSRKRERPITYMLQAA